MTTYLGNHLESHQTEALLFVDEPLLPAIKRILGIVHMFNFSNELAENFKLSTIIRNQSKGIHDPEIQDLILSWPFHMGTKSSHSSSIEFQIYCIQYHFKLLYNQNVIKTEAETD